MKVKLRYNLGLIVAVLLVAVWVFAISSFWLEFIEPETSIIFLFTTLLTTTFGVFSWIQAVSSSLSAIKFGIGPHVVSPQYNLNVTRFPVEFEATGGLPFEIKFRVTFNRSTEKISTEANGFWCGERYVSYPPNASFINSAFHVEQTAFQNKDSIHVAISYRNKFVSVSNITYHWYYDSGKQIWVLNVV